MRKGTTRKLMICLAATVLLFLSASRCPAENLVYTYDDLNRLDQVIYPDGTMIKYAYDNVGNRREQRIESVDLVVTLVSGPSEAYLSQTGAVATTVRNQGEARAVPSISVSSFPRILPSVPTIVCWDTHMSVN